jgi:ketosteroid isomerase-like protein
MMNGRPSDAVPALQEIIQATHRYARGLDRFDPQEALSAFAPDAVWDATPVGLERFEGHEQILKFFERDAGAMANQFHIITNHIVEFDSADRAHGTNYVFSEGETKSGAKIRAIALNEDEYVKTAEGWRISSRVISPLTPPSMEGFDA